MPAMGKSKPKNWATGRWLIESMDQWDTDFIDEEVRGYFEFDAEDSRSMTIPFHTSRRFVDDSVSNQKSASNSAAVSGNSRRSRLTKAEPLPNFSVSLHSHMVDHFRFRGFLFGSRLSTIPDSSP
jgi:hypothetical protein